MVYEKIDEIGRDKFIQMHTPRDEATYSEYLTSVLVVVNKKREQQFMSEYITFLMNHNKNDYQNWEKRQIN